MAAEALTPIDCSDQPLDIAFHPSRDILAAALVDGTVEFHDFSTRCIPSLSNAAHAKGNAKKDDVDDDNDEDDTILSTIEVHCNDIPKTKIRSAIHSEPSSSCRTLLFSSDGEYLYTAGNGGSIACLNTEIASSYHSSSASIVWKVDNASPHGINVLHQLEENAPPGPLLVSGDDEGVVRLWDIRLCSGNSENNLDRGNKKKHPFDRLMGLPQGCVASFHENKDYISGFATDATCNTLLASSADGVMSVIDLRMNYNANATTKQGEENAPVKSGQFHLIRQSDNQEDELLSICVLKGGKKVVCGTQTGVLNIWSWGIWGDVSDRFPGHPQSIDTLLKIDERTLLTGSSDGVVRVIQIQPDKMLGVLGDHGGFPVEKMNFSSGKKLLGSVSHDNFIRLWDASILADDDVEDNNIEESSMEEAESSAIVFASKAKSSMEEAESSGIGFASKAKSGGSDNEWEDMDDSDDSMDSDSDSDDDEAASKQKPKKFMTENESFFQDL